MAKQSRDSSMDTVIENKENLNPYERDKKNEISNKETTKTFIEEVKEYIKTLSKKDFDKELVNYLKNKGIKEKDISLGGADNKVVCFNYDGSRRIVKNLLEGGK